MKIVLVSRIDEADALRYTASLARELEGLGHDVALEEGTAAHLGEEGISFEEIDGDLVVVVGGELSETGETLLAPLRGALLRHALPNRIAPLEVVRSRLGARAEMVGALALAVQSTAVPLTLEETVDVGGLG